MKSSLEAPTPVLRRKRRDFLKEALDAAHGHEHNEDGSEITQEQKAAKAMSEATPQGQRPSPRWVWFLSCLCVMQWILLAIKWGNRTKTSQ